MHTKNMLAAILQPTFAPQPINVNAILERIEVGVVTLRFQGTDDGRTWCFHALSTCRNFPITLHFSSLWALIHKRSRQKTSTPSKSPFQTNGKNFTDRRTASCITLLRTSAASGKSSRNSCNSGMSLATKFSYSVTAYV